MSEQKKKKSQSKQKSQNPSYSNDQLGENAGEGRLMKEMDKKNKRKL